MARFVDAIDLPLDLAGAFDLLADFSRLPEWDPGAFEARRLDAGPLRVGSGFEVLYGFLGRRLPLRYEIRAYERPYRVVLHGGNDRVRSTDEIHFSPREGGTRVSYEARLEARGLASLAEPMLRLLFPWIGRAAVRGLRARAKSLAEGTRHAA